MISHFSRNFILRCNLRLAIFAKLAIRVSRSFFKNYPEMTILKSKKCKSFKESFFKGYCTGNRMGTLSGHQGSPKVKNRKFSR